MDYTYKFPDEENFLYSITQHLANQNNDEDKQLSALLTNIESITFSETDQYSDRWNAFWVVINIHAQQHLMKEFNKDRIDRFLEVAKLYMPSKSGYDISQVELVVECYTATSNWRDSVLKSILANGINNQASFPSSSHPMCTYNGMSFRSKTERKVAKELEKQDVLFYPLPLANYQGDTKENDFLVCKKGKWAALELVNDHFHNSVVKEANRQSWFQKHHVQMKLVSTNDAHNDAAKVVKEFLDWMDGI